MSDDLSDERLRQMLKALAPTPPFRPALSDVAVRRFRTTRRRERAALAVVGAAAAVCAIALPLAFSGGQSHSPAPLSSAALPTCGTVPKSNGPLADKVQLALVGAPSGASGATYNAELVVSSRGGTVSVMSTSVIDVLIVKNGLVIGRTGRPSPATLISYDVGPGSPRTLVAPIVLSGCPRIDKSTQTVDADASRKPLPPGDYELIARVDDVSNGSQATADLVSSPITIHVTAPGN